MITAATSQEIRELIELVNSAYRGPASRKGWTTEADLLDGELRTDDESMKTLMKKPGATILKFLSGEQLTGCVYLEKQKEDLYLGMLSVSPAAQSQGIGKKLLLAAEEFGKAHECLRIVMFVISLRHELIDWYERHGYQRNGETKPFPKNDRFGIAKQPLEFIVLEKKLG